MNIEYRYFKYISFPEWKALQASGNWQPASEYQGTKMEEGEVGSDGEFRYLVFEPQRFVSTQNLKVKHKRIQDAQAV